LETILVLLGKVFGGLGKYYYWDVGGKLEMGAKYM
jgi:hypothetical protein